VFTRHRVDAAARLSLAAPRLPAPSTVKEPAVKDRATRPETSPRRAASSPDAAPPTPAIIAHVFDRLGLRQRARMLGHLLAPVGPLALAVVSGGAFAKYVARARWPEIPVSVEDAARATSGQVYELVRYVQQSNPALVSQVMDALAADPTMIAALGASIAALAIRQRSPHGQARKAPAG
jgi:hypothetical protein